MSAQDSSSAALADALKRLRQTAWLDVEVTQAQVAEAIGVSAPTLSSYENPASSKRPTGPRVKAIAQFFASRRSLEGGKAHLVPVDQMQADELEEMSRIEALLSAKLGEGAGERRQLLSFTDDDPVVIICPEIPEKEWAELAQQSSRNFTRMHRYADLDALVEIFGHLRALNPGTQVIHRLPSTIRLHDLSNHLVVIGGIGWNRTTSRILSEIDTLPISQVADGQILTGEVFDVVDGESRLRFEPVIEKRTLKDEDGIEQVVEEMVEDVALLARLPNPFNHSRTLTICNGVHSRGVVGAVLAITDERVRPANEEYLARRFPQGAFAMLLRVPVIADDALAPDLTNSRVRLYEWQPTETEQS